MLTVKSGFVFPLLALVLALSPLWPESHAKADYRHKNRLVGSWLFTVDAGTLGGPPIKAVMNFEKGGTVIVSQTGAHENSAAIDPVCGCNASNGQGVWKRTGPNTYAFKFIVFAFAGSETSQMSLNLSEEVQRVGQHIGVGIIRGEVRVDRDTLEGTSLNEILNLDGENLNPDFPPFELTLTGERITVSP